ncbi:MAG: hypothetical protein AAB657_03965 [Patescibacteria group bacterium]
MPRTHYPSNPTRLDEPFEPGSSPVRRVVLSFLVAVVAITALVSYYALQRAEIILETAPTNTVVETELNMGDPAPLGGVSAKILQTELTGEKKFPASPSGDKEDRASGQVTLFNNQNTSQTLIATTRLLSADNILFRLKKTTTIPASGKITADVIADQTGEASAIPPSKFTIPGLKPAQQKKVYAESSEPMKQAEKSGNLVRQLDIEAARKNLSDTLTPQALAKLRETLPADLKSQAVIYKIEVTEDKSSVPAGTAVPEFTESIKIKVTAVFYQADTLREFVLNKLTDETPLGRQVLKLEDESLSLTLDTVASDLSNVQVKVKALAQVVLADPDQAINKVELIGRSPAEVKQYFESMPGVKSAETILSPFWVKTVPQIEKYITIKVKG